MTERTDVRFEQRMLIDGALVEGQAGTFGVLNPATEEVLGEVADASKADMHRAIDAARRAFDETDWSTNHAFRARCVRQLYEAMKAEAEQLRSIVVHEAGACVSLTGYMHVDDPIEMVAYWAEKAEGYPYEQAMSDIPFLGRQHQRTLRREAVGVVGAITPVSYRHLRAHET